VAAALAEDPNGEQMLQKLIVGLHNIVCAGSAPPHTTH
jgi:hypothetical protein